MYLVLLIIILILNFLIYSLFFKGTLLIIISLESSMIIFEFIIFLKYLISQKIELSKLNKINKEDKDKFIYYRDILKDFSIGELSYLYNGKKNIQLSVIAELEYLKNKKYITIENKTINKSPNINYSESQKYILNHYKFLKDKQFKKYYNKYLESSLKEKGCIKHQFLNIDHQTIIYYIIFFFIFFTFWRYAASFFNGNKNLQIFQAILFLIFWLQNTIIFSILKIDASVIKTEKGKEIYLKLNGLKNYLEDFGNFDNKQIKEIVLWEEYILYAIILDASKSLTEESKKEYQNLLEIIKK